MTSVGFCATLPDLTDQQFQKLMKRTQDTCVKSDFLLNEDGSLQFISIRKEAKDARSWMRLLRTNLSNWGVEMKPKQVGWLKCISEEEYDTMKQKVHERPAKSVSIEAAQTSRPMIEAAKPYEASRLKLPVNLLTCP